MPKPIRGRAAEHLNDRDFSRSIRTLESAYAPLIYADRVKALEVLVRNKSSKQLRNRPNAILVKSLWHRRWVERDEALPQYAAKNAGPTPQTGLLYAATYGKQGEPVLLGDEFGGKPNKPGQQPTDGLLTRSSTLAAVLWILHSGPPIPLERKHDQSGTHLTGPAQRLLRAVVGLE